LLAVAAALGAAALAGATPAGATKTVIRTGGPSAPADAKVAIVASERNLGGGAFTVTDGGKVVLRGRLRPAAGSSAPWAHAYRADLSALKQLGAFKVHAAGVTSRPWRIRARGTSDLIPLLLRYFETQRDGNEPALLHGPSHLHDAVVEGGPHDGQQIDLTGGWMDAGDMIHFAQTTAFSAALLQAAARLDPANAAALNTEADVGIRWLLKAHPFPDLFVVQVGGVVDHAVGFRDPAGDDSSSRGGIGTRVAYHWETGVGGDIGGKAAAALALAADREPDALRKARLLTAAREWYAAGKAAGRSTPRLPGTGGFYFYRTFKSSLAAGAAALFRSTGEAAYLDDARTFLRTSGQRYELLEGANMAPFAAADLCGALGAPALGDAAARAQGCRFLSDTASSTRDYARANAFAPASYFQWGTSGVNSAGGLAAALAASGAGFGGGRAIAAGARDYLLGRNAWGASLVVGFGPNSPKQPHHWASVFPPHRGLPQGALVGGPAPRDQILTEAKSSGFKLGGPLRAFNSDIAYEDHRPDYVTSEPAIDYSATAILLLAAL
jgi:endoglucanase